MKKHIDCGDPVDLLVRDYDDGLPILKLYRQQNPGIKSSIALWTVEDVPFYFANDLFREEADELAEKLNQLGATVEIIG
jgi:ribosomal protein L7/L12